MSTTISNQTRIIIFLFLSLIFGVRSDVIDTIPSLPNNTLANGYFNLIVKTQFTRPSQTCGWYYQGNRIEPDFWSSGESGVACNSKQFPSNDRKYNISCNDLGNEIASNFTILENINKGTLNASVYCNGSPLLTLPTITITVQDCTPTLPYNVTVEATTYQFNDIGTFSCPSNTTLFTSDRNMLPTSQTTCQATAKWENEGFVQCLTVTDGSLSLTLIIGISCAAAVIVILLIVIAVILFRRRKKQAGNEALHKNSKTSGVSAYEQVDKEREERNNPLYASQNPLNVQDKLNKIDDMKVVYYASTTSQNDVDTAYSTLDTKTRNGSTGLHGKEENRNKLYSLAATSQAAYAHGENKSIDEKQENINPLYGPSAQSQAAYTEVENKNFSEKQENINPLYGPSTQSGFNEKQENINPLYGPSAQPHTGYAEVKNKSFDEKQENVNPLYGLSAQSTVDYAQDSNEKQENINPLYGPSAQSDIKGDSEKEEKVNPLYAPSKCADGGSTC